MELAPRHAKTRFSEIAAAAQRGERVVVTKNGEPAVEPVRCRKRRGGIDFDRLEDDCRRLGIEDGGERWPSAFDDPAFSRQVLGLDDGD